MDERAAAPVAGKALEIAILVVFVGVVSAALFGSVVPTYRTAAGAEVGDRTLVAVVGQVDTAAVVTDSVVERRVAVSMPRTIRGSAYVVRAVNGNQTPTLVLDHPHAGVGGAVPLSVPAETRVNGSLQSTSEPTVVVTQESGRIEVVLR
ncbi:hypothetical protein C2R22_03570 [Salinigranum rubrum]|uniref:Uncharacterized protein n=1 Tax=Salinigranum rubrum TaxID=755307 RepID=A0A2I8VFZ5_9EURY|nr:hypothetical protein [Salinigranum rubrum]AUV80853.1 hypothetical protein C2R22_03570 [Salinigranum rubrum]